MNKLILIIAIIFSGMLAKAQRKLNDQMNKVMGAIDAAIANVEREALKPNNTINKDELPRRST